MPTKNSTIYSILLIAADIFVLMAAFTLAYILRVQHDPRPLVTKVYALEYIQIFMMIVPFWIVMFGLLGLYSPKTYSNRLVEWFKIGAGALVGILLILGWEYVTERAFFPARLVAVYALVGSFALLVIEREVMQAVRRLLYRFKIGTNNLLIIGSTKATKRIAKNLADTPHSGYTVVAIAGPSNVKPPTGSKVQYFSSVTAALEATTRLKIDAIIQTSLHSSSGRNQSILAAAQARHIDYSFIPGDSDFYSGKNTASVLLGYPVISVSQTPLIGWGAVVKRVFDVIMSGLALIVLSPVFLLLTILQKIFNPGPAFYFSQRLSRYHKPINFIKFRSMKDRPTAHLDAAQEFRAMGRDDLAKEYEAHRKVTHDPRITRFGAFLRASSLDELPQLINVFKGDISLVGPRPILPQEMKLVKDNQRTALLHSVRSGLTGLWQVSGRNKLSFNERIELELFYAQNWSFWLDIKILCKTVIVVIKKAGAK